MSDFKLSKQDKELALQKYTAKEKWAERIDDRTRIVKFKGATLIEVDGEWEDMSSNQFAEAAYKALGNGTPKSRVADLEHLFRARAQDLSDRAHYIAFPGMDDVWDTKKVDWTREIPAEDCVYRVHAIPQATKNKKVVDKDGRMKFIMQLANGDEGVYDDIMQTVAPLFLDKKPTGVVWYLGGGANGKSTLVHLLYIIFGNYLTEITVRQLEDERDTPQLNGKLGNICKESSEGFVEDTRTYKSIGTHEGFLVHKFHSQDMVKIEGNVHHIFSTNNIPVFGDKSYGARRRTLVIPFTNRFRPDESFEDKTFTPEFVDHFLYEMLEYARKLKSQNYEYRFHEVTQATKEKYDTDANTAMTYLDEIVDEGVLGFLSFQQLHADYENWCGEHGYKPSTISVLRKEADEKGFSRKSARENGVHKKLFLYKDTSYTDLERAGGLQMGMYRKIGEKEEIEEDEDTTLQENMLGDWA